MNLLAEIYTPDRSILNIDVPNSIVSMGKLDIAQEVNHHLHKYNKCRKKSENSYNCLLQVDTKVTAEL